MQRKFRIGYNRSARIIDLLESQGLIMPTSGGKTRRVVR
ncbi:MAG: DNA translocase FtsK [bacterium]|nr:DNA translocase FtsK [bacterium]